MGFWIFAICLIIVLAIIFYFTSLMENVTEDVEDVIERLKEEQYDNLLNTKHNCKCSCHHEEEHECKCGDDHKCGENCKCRK
jgi:uncharacterized protein YpmB